MIFIYVGWKPQHECMCVCDMCLYRATYLAGEMLCSVNDMIRLSAILTQIIKGDYISEK